MHSSSMNAAAARAAGDRLGDRQPDRGADRGHDAVAEDRVVLAQADQVVALLGDVGHRDEAAEAGEPLPEQLLERVEVGGRPRETRSGRAAGRS